MNRPAAAQMLKQAGIPFESKNGGAHLIVAGRYDFWPGTGLWQARGEATKQRGVRRLIARLQAQAAENERLRKLLCQCDMRARLVGDGCEFCNPTLADELEKEQR